VALKTFYRRNQVQFVQEFVDGGTPLVPYDPTYPKYSIKDPSNNTVQSGTANLVSGGTYRVDWFVPNDAPQSTENQRWVIEWTFFDENQRQVDAKEYFEVKDEVLIEDVGRDQKFIALPNTPYLFKVSLRYDPQDISLQVVNVNDDTDVLTTASKSELTHTIDNVNGLHVFSKQLSAGITADSTYMILWTVTESASSTPRNIFQRVEGVNLKVLSIIPEVRMLIDKFQKGVGSVTSYEDTDIHEYIVKGQSMINNFHPLTTWGVCVSSPMWYLNEFLVIAAAYYGLMAQYLVEGDMAFNFSGLSTVLDVDRTSMLDTAINRMLDHVKELLPPAKMKLYRSQVGVGAVGIRAFGRSPIRQQYTFRISSGPGTGVLDRLVKLGILTW